jgi:preprotein translocase subunit SecB
MYTCTPQKNLFMRRASEVSLSLNLNKRKITNSLYSLQITVEIQVEKLRNQIMRRMKNVITLLILNV